MLTGWVGGQSGQVTAEKMTTCNKRDVWNPRKTGNTWRDKGPLWFSGQKIDFCSSSRGRARREARSFNCNWHLARVGGWWGILLWLIDLGAPGWFPEEIYLYVFVLGYCNFFMFQAGFGFGESGHLSTFLMQTQQRSWAELNIFSPTACFCPRLHKTTILSR